MSELTNLNYISRMELLDTLKVLPSGSDSTRQIATVLNGTPLVMGGSSEDDIFDIQFDHATLEAIAYAVEQYADEVAAPYVETIEEGTNKASEDRSFQYWQALCERWGYLELMQPGQ